MKMRSVCVFALAMLGASSAFAQTQDEFVAAFSGSWQIVDPSYANGSACMITLDRAPKDSGYALKSEGCSGPVIDVASWKILGDQLGLFNQKGDVIAKLGGNLNRLTGDTSWKSAVILERVASVKEAERQRKLVRCVYVGYTSDCASIEKMSRPVGSAAGGNPIKVGTLTRLNVRSEPRLDAQVTRQLAAKECVSVSYCVTASDGNWCRIAGPEGVGWVQQTSVRLGQFLVLTYAGGCSASGS